MKAILFSIGVCALTAAALHGHGQPARLATAATSQAARPGERVEVPPPPFSDGIFPCTFCHDNKDLKPNLTRRTFPDDHSEIVLKHDEQNRWCLDCHDAQNRDVLHLASGEKIPFDESYRLCGQCHGEKYRDWRAGVHGRRTGQWNGQKSYLLCVHCHSPHQPHFKPMTPKPAPLPPTRPKQNLGLGDKR
jgi:hypothetical protein